MVCLMIALELVRALTLVPIRKKREKCGKRRSINHEGPAWTR
jgi:hypothetical protein